MTFSQKLKEFLLYKIFSIFIPLTCIAQVFFTKIFVRLGVDLNWNALKEPETYFHLIFNLIIWSLFSYFIIWKPNREKLRKKRKQKEMDQE
jgi:uncharacterized membrane protein